MDHRVNTFILYELQVKDRLLKQMVVMLGMASKQHTKQDTLGKQNTNPYCIT